MCDECQYILCTSVIYILLNISILILEFQNVQERHRKFSFNHRVRPTPTHFSHRLRQNNFIDICIRLTFFLVVGKSWTFNRFPCVVRFFVNMNFLTICDLFFVLLDITRPDVYEDKEKVEWCEVFKSSVIPRRTLSKTVYS